MNTSAKLTKFVQASGCAAKLAPDTLSSVTCRLKSFHENLIVGFEGNEDAGVYKIDENLAMVQTVDFITPVVDDPFVYGQIAAANSLSDIFAMGADAKSALNVVGFDSKHHQKEILCEILLGAQDKANECGAVIIGGHTIQTPEMIFGLSATGFVHPNKILRNNTINKGDVVILTKPLGMGILITAIKADLLDMQTMQKVADNLKTLNYKASLIAREFNATACTDVTGFGFLGHLNEMSASRLSIEVEFEKVPFMKEAIEFAKMGIIPAGSYANKGYLKDKVFFKKPLSFEEEMILFDAQTSGGLLISASPKNAQNILKKCKEEGIFACEIGEVSDKKEQNIIVG
ncbi:MAG: selenide, water dikinase [Campylobacterota bacterium]|nr:selenide, water dikinase [Campylobacterota bacterium]